DLIGSVGKGRSAFVGGNNEIGIVGIVAHNAFRRHNPFAVNVISDRQHARDEVDICCTTSFKHLLPSSSCRQATRIEAALGADRYDHAVLDLLCLHKPQDFRAIILAAIRPTQASASNRSEAKMNTLNLRPIDEDFTPWPWL